MTAAGFRPDPPKSFGDRGSYDASGTGDDSPQLAARRHGPVAPIARLIDAFRKLPGVGPKTAQRLAYHVIRGADADAKELSDAIRNVLDQLAECQVCADITTVDAPRCRICIDQRRDQTVICVVQEPMDIVAIERTRSYGGMYHVLHGVISPTNGVGPSDLKVAELMARLKAGSDGSDDDGGDGESGAGTATDGVAEGAAPMFGQAQPTAPAPATDPGSARAPAPARVSEVIVATNPNLDGEATAMHLQRLIEPLGISVTRIARGIPSGSDIEFADDATLAHALATRSRLG